MKKSINYLRDYYKIQKIWVHSKKSLYTQFGHKIKQLFSIYQISGVQIKRKKCNEYNNKVFFFQI